MARISCFCVLTFALLCLAPCLDAKTVSGTFHLTAGDLTHGPEYEITKFSFEVGEGSVSGTFTFADPKTWATSPALYLFNDEKWDKYHDSPACTDKVEHAFAAIPIGKQTRSHHDILHDNFGQASSSNTKTLRNGQVEWSFQWRINHQHRTHGWFVVAADCALEQYNTQVSPMQYSITLLNNGNTHLPADEYGLPRLYLFVFLGMNLCAAFMIIKRLSSSMSSSDTQQTTHLVVHILGASFVLQYTSLLLELVHLFFYKRNGSGVFLCDFFSEVFEGLSQTLMAFVLICLASGWTLVNMDFDKSKGNSLGTLLRNPKRLLEGTNVVIFGILSVVAITFVLQVLNKGFDDDFKKFHDFESPPGRLLVALRLFLGVFFIYSIHVTVRFQESRGGDKLLAFLKRLRFLGGLWFLSFPLIVGIAGLFPHYLRHRVVTSGMLTLQSTLLVTLGYQFISESSSYFRLSTLADSGVLPGAGGLVRAPKASRD